MGATEAIAPANDDLQGSLPIADIKYGVVRTRDGGYAALFEVLPTNYFLQSTAERIRIISNLAAWLRIAPDNLQILCLSQPVDVEQYTRRMEGFLQSEGDALCRTCIEDNINEVNQLVRYGAFTTRFYIAYRYEPSMVSGEVSYAKIAAALRQVMDSSVGYLARCGLNVVNPGYIDNHLVETVFRMLCKRTSEHIRLPLYFRDMLQECYGVPQQPEPDPEGGEETTTGAAKQDTPSEAEERKNTGRHRKQQKTTEQFEATGVMDLICPAAVDFTHKDYIEMDGVCHAYLYIAGYGYKSLVRGGWMAALAGMGDGISVSMTLQRRSREKILPKVANSTIWSRSRIRDVDNTRADFEQMDSAITAGIYIKDQMNRAGEDYYDMYTLIEVTADDPELLEIRVSDVERHCTSLELIVKRCDYLEEQAFHSFLPVVSMAPEIERKARRNALLSGVASAFPFYSMELCEQRGILIGQDMQRKSICMLDIFDSDRYNNANTIVLGTSGAGKTFLLQLIAMRYRQQGKQVCLIAPYKGYEYRAACEAIGGLYIKLAPSSTDCINFMEIREESLRARQQEESEQERNRSLLADKISQLHIYFSLLRRNLTEEDMEQLDVALTQLYRSFCRFLHRPKRDSRCSRPAWCPNAPHRTGQQLSGGSCRCRFQKSSHAWRYRKIPGVSSPLRCQGVCAAARQLHAQSAAPSGSRTLPGGGQARKASCPPGSRLLFLAVGSHPDNRGNPAVKNGLPDILGLAHGEGGAFVLKGSALVLGKPGLDNTFPLGGVAGLVWHGGSTPFVCCGLSPH